MSAITLTCGYCGAPLSGTSGYTGAGAYHYDCAAQVYGADFRTDSPTPTTANATARERHAATPDHRLFVGKLHVAALPGVAGGIPVLVRTYADGTAELAFKIGERWSVPSELEEER